MDFCAHYLHILFVYLLISKGLYGYQDEADQNIFIGM